PAARGRHLHHPARWQRHRHRDCQGLAELLVQHQCAGRDRAGSTRPGVRAAPGGLRRRVAADLVRVHPGGLVTAVRPRFTLLALVACLGLAGPLAAQQDVVRLGITYRAGARPGIIVLAAAGLDSVRKIVERDLDYSDRFEVAVVADSVAPLSGELNLGLWRQYGLAWAVELRPVIGGVEARLHDLGGDRVALQVQRGVDPAGSGPQ